MNDKSMVMDTTTNTGTGEGTGGATVTDLIALHYFGGGSDKVWAAAVVEEADGTGVMLSCWGRRGASLQIGIKKLANLAAAQKLFGSKKREKLGEGYDEIDPNLYGIGSTLNSLHPAVSTASIGPSAPATQAASVEAAYLIGRQAPRIVVSHVTPIRDADLPGCLANDEYGITEKVNGTRCVVTFNGVTLHAYNRRGVEQPVVPGAARALAQLGEPFTVDGERMEGDGAGGYVMFDLLEWGAGSASENAGTCAQSVRDWPYSRRIEQLYSALLGAGLITQAGATAAQTVSSVPGLALLVPATDPTKKQAVMTEVKQAGGEGIIIRTLNAPSLPGTCRHERKHKFVADVDAIVISVKPGISTGSVRLGLVRPKDGAIIEVGCVRSGLRDADIAHLETLLSQAHGAGDGERSSLPVLTVSFLKARTVGIALVEPTTSIRNLRTDKLASECTTDQLVEILGDDRAAMIDNARPYSLHSGDTSDTGDSGVTLQAMAA